MYSFVFSAHSGWRYAVLLAAVITALYALIGLARRGPVDKAAVTLVRIFVVTLDIQMLLGIVLLVLDITSGRWFAALIGHLVLVVGAVAVAHLFSDRVKKLEPAQRTWMQVLAVAMIPLLLILAGIMAMQRPIL